MVATDLSVENNIDEPHPYRAGWGLMNSPDPAGYLVKRILSWSLKAAIK